MPITDARRLNILKQLKPKMNEEQTKQLEAFLDDTSPLAQTFTEQFLAREDYSRQVQEATKAAQAAQAEQAKLTEKYSQLQTWETSAKLDLQRKEAQAASVAKRAVDQLNALRTKAQADSLTVSDFAPDPLIAQFSTLSTDPVPSPAHTVPPTNNQLPPQNNLNPNQVRDAENQLIDGIASLFDLSSKHQRLFNQPLDTGSLIREAQRTNTPIVQLYDQLFNPSEQESKVQREAMRAELRTEIETELKTKYSTLDPSLQSMDMGNMSKLIDATSSSALKFQGPGNDAASLNKGFVASAPPGQPPPGAPPAGSPPPPNDSFDRRNEEAAWGKEFMENLAAKL